MLLIIALIVIGLILLLVEIVLLPGVTVAGIASFASFGGALYIAFTEFGNSVGFIVVGVILLISVVSIVLALRSKMWDRLALNQNIDGSIDKLPCESEIKVGDKAMTVTRLNPIGTVEIGNKSYEGKSLNALIDPGVAVEVVRVENSQIIVKKLAL